MKKFLLVIAIVLSFGITVDIFYKQKNPVENYKPVEKVENNNFFSESEKVLESPIENEKDEIDDKFQNQIASTENSKGTEDEPIANIGQTIPEKVADKNTEIPKTEQKVEVDIVEKTNDVPTSKQEEVEEEPLENSFPQEIPKEEVKPEVEDVEKEDSELEKYQQQVEFATYDECMNKGFEESLKDTVNIFGFSCPYIAYKGQILGYRLNLDYSNPME